MTLRSFEMGFYEELYHLTILNQEETHQGLELTDQNCVLRSSKFLGCWPIRVKQFAVEAEEHVTDSWTIY